MPARKSESLAIVHQPGAQLYRRFVEGIKERIRTAQLKAALAANAELVLHYWEIGREILANQKREGWGAKIIDRLAADLQREFPKLAGYSSRNLKYMRAFAAAWPDRAIVHQLAAQIPWKHNCVLLDRVKDAKTREFYIRETVGQGWSRSVLVHHLDTDLHKRAGKAPSNFALTLPSPQSDLAKELLKDPYVFKPAPLDESANERALESALIARLKDFLIELGSGFAFVGKMNFYQAAVDDLLKTARDGPTIGIILCRGKNKTIVEYTLRDAKSPIGVAEYRLLPPKLKAELPETKELKQIVTETELPRK
jgi:predicted nuclease of restriction endonuclease-like (RecB) superfamily